MQVVVVVAETGLEALEELAVVALVVAVLLLELLELLIQAAVAAVVGFFKMAVQAVAVSSSFAIQTHLLPHQAQQVHQRLLWLEALGSTDSQPLVLLRSDHGHH
jgi:hypothetical protein